MGDKVLIDLVEEYQFVTGDSSLLGAMRLISPSLKDKLKKKLTVSISENKKFDTSRYLTDDKIEADY